MYEKKIRKSRRAIPAVVDADTEMQDIICSWKNKWKMDLTKPILNCVTSVYPRVLVDPSRQDSDHLAAFYSLLTRFLARLRAEHEDETNFKLVLQVYDRQIEYMTADKYQASSKATVKGLLTMARDLADGQLQAFERNSEAAFNEDIMGLET
jgi:phosphoribosylformylglycinamidine (FGAM) synthase-like enzyme